VENESGTIMTDRIKVFTALNHQGNEYELLKITKKYPIKFYYLENNVRRWSSFGGRPEPTSWLTKDEFEWVTYYEPGKYDVAILRNDQQHADPLIGKGQLYRALNEVIRDIPKIVVNHGTPKWDENFTEDVVKFGGQAATWRGISKIDGISDLVKDAAIMLVNSYEAVERWNGVHDNIYPTIHGLDEKEWLDLPKEPRVVLPLSPAGLDAYYNRSLCTAIKGAVLERSGITVMHPNVNITFDGDNFAQYREFIGSSLITIYPFKDSPMPRSRTEAMLSGCVILSSRYHGAKDFIEHGVDGFIVPDNPLSYAEAIHVLINEAYKEAVEMGQRGKEKAKKIFSLERYHKDMYHIISEVANGRVPKWDGTKIWDNL
jgi:glycosyltransferase involved in cell wall biosynthesis